jgi:DNA mismatch endonuclease, patch repair protein
MTLVKRWKMDIWSKEKRSEVMRRIRSGDTKPELAIRSALHRLGFRFRLNNNRMSGKPDIVLPRFGTAIFVHGCFWHQHKRCIDGRMPKSRPEYWVPKLTKNVVRDRRSQRQLRKDGWCVLVVWECQIERDMDAVLRRVLAKLKEQDNAYPARTAPHSK